LAIEKQFQCSSEKKNIFLIGDSIRIGYCRTVKELLAEEAEVFYVTENCRNTQYVMTGLLTWIHEFSDPSKIDIVHFNCGHWDAAQFAGNEPLTTEAEFRRNIRLIIESIRNLFPNAKIVFATTTPMNPVNRECVCPRSTEDIIRYNQIAEEVVSEHNIPINDLFAVTKDWDASCFADYCHFTPDSNKILGKIVAERLKTYF